MTIVVGLAVLLRRGWKPALFHVIPLAACYLVWFAVIGHEGYTSASVTVRTLLDFVISGLRATYREIGQLPGVGVLLAVVLVVGLVLVFVDRGAAQLRARLAEPIALLVGSPIFLAITAVGRATVLGPATARADRYVYLVAAMTLPALAVAADALARRQPLLFPVVLALFFAAIPGNVDALHLVTPTDRHLIFSLPRDPTATRVPRAVRPDPISAPWVTIGWLLDATKAGRIPEPGVQTSDDLRRDDFRLSFLQTHTRESDAACRSQPLRLPATVALMEGDVIGVYQGERVLYGASDAIRVSPASAPGVHAALVFVARDGGDVSVLRDVGPTRIRPGSAFYPPRVCVIRAALH
jgi:hypothetical protein